jgi:hypothetical protein
MKEHRRKLAVAVAVVAAIVAAKQTGVIPHVDI